MRACGAVAASGTRALLLLCLVVSLVAPGESWAQAGAAALRLPAALAYDSAGDLFIADASRNQVLEATVGGSLVVVAGTGVQGFGGDGGPAVSAELNGPQGLAWGPDGTLFIADSGNARVRAVSAGVITTYAGDGVSGFSGDGGAATAASLRAPTGLAVDSTGALLVCDTGNNRVRRISGGVIATVAGAGVQGFAGDGGAAIAAELDSPAGIAVGKDGRVFVADSHNQRVRAIDASGVISTFAGTGQRGFGGDGGAAAAALLSGPRGLALTATGELLVADTGNQRVRTISAAGIISTVAGSGVEGASEDAVAGADAALDGPRDVAASPFGPPTMADSLNGTVREAVAGLGLFRPAALAGARASGVTLQVPGGLVYGQGAANIAVSGTVGVPEGQVRLLADGVAMGQTALSAGAANVPLGLLGAGSHTIVASYLGDGLNAAASGPAIAASVAPATVTAKADAASVEYGLPLPALSGEISGVLPQDAGQVSAVFSTGAGDLPDVGTYAIEASLTGPKSANYSLNTATGPGVLTVTQARSATLLGSVGQSYTGLPLRLSATVGSSTRGQPTGSVQFLDGDVVVATAALNGGVVSGVYLSPPGGARSLVARYSGDENFLPSTSAVQVATISGMPDFAIAAANAGGASAVAGGLATFSLVISGQPGPFTGAVALSASGLPAGASVSFSPPQVVPGAGSAMVTVTVQTAPPAVSLWRGLGRGPTRGVAWGFGVVAVFAWRRGRRWRALPWLCVVVFLAGCGARTVGEGSAGVVTQNYTLQVTGTATNLVGAVVTHSTSVILTVQQ